jgi:ParB-like chromosome segregation protein Spo0J
MTSTPVRMAFEEEGKLIPIESIVPTRTVGLGTQQSAKFLRIQASIREIGLVEPLVVFPSAVHGREERFVLLDGHLRLEVLKGMGTKEVLCLISRDDESFTYNHKVNQLSAVQEHYMIKKAIDSGVSMERISVTLNLDLASIRRKRDLLDGICPEAVELIKDRKVTPGAIRVLKKVVPLRQIAMAELMIASQKFTETHARVLLAATSPEDLVEKETPKELDGMRPQDLAVIEREMQVLEKDFRRIKDSFGRNTLNLVLAVGYVRRLLANAAVVKCMSRRYGDVLAEFEKLAEATDLGDGSGVEASESESP